MGSYYRHPKTLQEMKANQDWHVRWRRRSHMLPTAWDDVPRNRDDRSWKRYRKTQYRAVLMV